MRVKFFVGKGGVGKTSVAASYAVYLSTQGYKTLIVSLDPAHNLGDILGIKLSDKVSQVGENLFAREVDIDREISSYLNKIASSLKMTYRYLSVLNMDSYFNVLRFSPGMEEQATLESIKKYVFSNEFDFVLFDTAPTGHTLRVLSLPSVSSIWVDELIKIRRLILDRRGIIERVKGKSPQSLPSREEDDDVMRELIKIKEECLVLEKKLRSEEVTYIPILNAEEVPLIETERIVHFLERFGMHIEKIVVNKYMPDKILKQKEVMDKIITSFAKYEIKVIPYTDESPRGLEKLKEVCLACLI
ncbi:MAG: ArsA family ATPase [Synergistetes bacterium]|nr:ArsA family ATPase [Synergistota bacterium]MCX8127987.1 ArsA family ATPase [Synergistota bacterium]MDW8192818.1 ArsA family ATPase [Synergistota bacterium]